MSDDETPRDDERQATDPYAKVFRSIVRSSIWNEAEATRVVWITLLVEADRFGRIEASIGGLARLANVSREACEEAVRVLLSPDPDDRSHVKEGRRLEVIPGGWQIVNHATYRAKGRNATRRDYFREKKQEQRARAAPKKPTKFDPLAVPIPLELQSPGFAEEWAAFVDYRRRLGKPFRTENGPAAALRHLAPLGPARAVLALQITREKEWQGVEHGIAELERRSPAPAAAATPARAARSAAEQLELERRRVISDAFAKMGLTTEARDSIVEAANRATCVEDLRSILWP